MYIIFEYSVLLSYIPHIVILWSNTKIKLNNVLNVIWKKNWKILIIIQYFYLIYLFNCTSILPKFFVWRPGVSIWAKDLGLSQDACFEDKDSDIPKCPVWGSGACSGLDLWNKAYDKEKKIFLNHLVLEIIKINAE